MVAVLLVGGRDEGDGLKKKIEVSFFCVYCEHNGLGSLVMLGDSTILVVFGSVNICPGIGNTWKKMGVCIFLF